MESKASSKRILAAERRTRALELRKEGKTFAQIGTEMGFSEQRAHKLVTLELARLNARRAEQAEAVTRLELERLDALLAAVWDKAKGGDLAAVDRVLSIMQRRGRFLGLDAPERRSVTSDGRLALALRAEDLTDDQLAALAGPGGPRAALPSPGPQEA